MAAAAAVWIARSMCWPEPVAVRWCSASSGRHRCGDRRDVGGHRGGRQQRGLRGEAGLEHEPGPGFEDVVVGDHVAVGAAVAEGGDRRDDEVRVAPGDRCGVGRPPGSDDSIHTSASANSPWSRSSPAAVAVSTTTPRLLALRQAWASECRTRADRTGRCVAGVEPAGDSTSSTSAPRSASRRPQSSPRPSVLSTTRMPWSGARHGGSSSVRIGDGWR